MPMMAVFGRVDGRVAVARHAFGLTVVVWDGGVATASPASFDLIPVDFSLSRDELVQRGFVIKEPK